MIHCHSISKSFKSGETSLKVLKDINLAVNPGEFIMIMGPSGCGKTTLLSILAGILKPDDGTCTINNIPINTISRENLLAFRGKNVGFIFQAFNLLPALTVIENISLPLLINNQDRKIALAKAQNILEKVGLQGKEEVFPQLLSGGQQQRVAIARALVHKPKLLICDEPTSALDQTMGNTIVSLLKHINQTMKMTCVIVTHDQRITPFADRVILMDDGQIIEKKT